MSDVLHTVLGASGGAGGAIVDALTETGRHVRAVSRSMQAGSSGNLDTLNADITDPGELLQAIDGSDVVYMAAQPPYHRWAVEFPEMLATVIDAVVHAEARLVMVGNLYVYGPSSEPLNEASPRSATTKKGRVRIHMAEMIEEAVSLRGLRATIGRASDYFGPGADNSAITALAIAPGAAGKPIKWMGSVDKLHSVAYLPDIARAYVALGDHTEADGDEWILPHAPAQTGSHFLEVVNTALPRPARTGSISRSMLMMAAPFHKISRESLEMVYQYTQDFVVDDSKFQEAFGPFATTPLDEAILATVTHAINPL